MVRRAGVTCDTNGTKIRMTLNLGGTSQAEIHTSIGFSDHMLHGLTCHDLFDLRVSVEGDLEVDAHHTIEDIGTVLRKVIRGAADDKKGIIRYGPKILPMDEALILYALDSCDRLHLVHNLILDREKASDLETEMICEFFYVVSCGAEMNPYLKQFSGINSHHTIEATFKAFAKSLGEVTRYDERVTGVLSTKESSQKMERIYERIAKIGGRNRVQKVVLFGSRVRNINHEKSDIDIAVYGCDDFEQFRHEAEEQTWTLLQYDIIDMEQDGISGELKQKIKKDEVILYRKI